MTDLHPDVIGTMAGLSGTDEPFDGCPSCHRAIIYGAMAHLSAAAVALQGGNPEVSLEFLSSATQVLMTFSATDFASLCDTEGYSEEDWTTAYSAFLRARIEHYVDLETGQVRTEPHPGEVIDGGEGPVGVE